MKTEENPEKDRFGGSRKMRRNLERVYEVGGLDGQMGVLQNGVCS